MGKKIVKYGALAATGGLLLQFGGCLGFGGGGMWNRLVWQGVTYAGFEFLTDNDAVFDLFQDDFGTGTQYDDRFTGGDASRVEPVDAADAGQNFQDD